jgi:hypothetical protein
MSNREVRELEFDINKTCSKLLQDESGIGLAYSCAIQLYPYE